MSNVIGIVRELSGGDGRRDVDPRVSKVSFFVNDMEFTIDEAKMLWRAIRDDLVANGRDTAEG